MATPSLKFLKTFQLAARNSSFKLAADELCITASAVSHQIKVLEEQLGLPLFDRGAHSLQLTEAGNVYLQNLDAVFSRLESATEQVRTRFGKLLVRLQVPPLFASELLLPRLSQFSAMNADVDIHVDTHLAPLSEHTSDADISVLVGNGNWPELATVRLFSQRFVVAAAPHVLQRRQINCARDLDGESLLVHARRLDLWDRWASLQGVEPLQPRQMIRLDSMSAIVHAAEQGVGFALVSTPLTTARFCAGTLQQLFNDELVPDESYYLVARHDDAKRSAVRSLMDWLLSEFGQAA